MHDKQKHGFVRLIIIQSEETIIIKVTEKYIRKN